MLINILNYLKLKLSHKANFQTFTYFIPGPPLRKSGYREKEIDSLFEQLSNLGFALVDFETQALNHGDQPGLWIMARLFPMTKEAKKLKVSDFPKEIAPVTQPDENPVEGIYYID